MDWFPGKRLPRSRNVEAIRSLADSRRRHWETYLLRHMINAEVEGWGGLAATGSVDAGGSAGPDVGVAPPRTSPAVSPLFFFLAMLRNTTK